MKQSVLKILWCLALAVVADLGHSATIITTQPGNWFTDTNNDPLAWGAQVPGAGDDVLLTNSVTFNGIANGVSVVQDLDIGPGGALYLNSGQLQVQGTNSLWTAGSVAYGGDPASGPLLQAGNLTISSLQDFYIAGLPTGGLDTVLINSGTIVQTNTGSVSVSGAYVINLNNATYEIKSDAGINFVSGNGAGIENSGLFLKSGGTGTSVINIDFANSNGTQSAQSGTLRYVRSYSSINGIFNIGSGASLVVANGAGLISNAVFKISSAGAIDLTAGGNSPPLKGLFTGSGTGFFELSSGTLSAQTPCTFDFPAGFFHWTGGALTWPGNVLTNLGEIDIDGTNIATLANNSILANQGTMLQNNAGALSMDWSSLLHNLPGGTYEFQSDSGIVVGGGNPGRTIVNEGLFRKTGGTGQSVIQVLFDNQGGTIEVDTGAVALSGGGSSSNGIYQVASGAELLVAGGTVNGATFQPAAGALIDLTGGASGPTYSGLLTGSGGGLLQIGNGTFFARSCTFNFPTNFFQWSGGTVDVTSSTLTNSGFMTVNAISNNLVGGTCCLNVGGTIVNQGTFVEINTGSLGLDRGIVFTNSPSGIYNLQSDGAISDNSGGWGGNKVDNVGLFVKSSGTGVSLIGVPFNSYNGTVEVDSGQLELAAGGMVNGALYNVKPGAVLDISGGSTATYSGLSTGSGGGTVLLSSGTVAAQVPCIFNFPSNLFQWTGGTIDVTGGALTNLGVISASAGSNNFLNGNFPGGSLVNLSLFVQNNLGNLILGRNTHFTNTAVGLYDLQSDAGISDGSGGFGGEAMDNVGIFQKSAGTGVSLIGVPFNSYGGTIQINSGRINLAAGGKINGAVFNVGAGAMLDVSSGPAPTWNGTLTGTGPGTVLFANGTVNARVPCNLNFPSSLFQWVGGTINVTGNSLTNLGFITVNTASNSILDGTFPGGRLVNQGTFVQLNAGNFGLGRLTHFTNTTAGLYDLQSDGGISDSSGGWGGNAVDNVGLFRKSGGTNVSWIGVPFNSYGGTIEVDSGQINLAAGGTANSAIFNLGAGAVLDLTAGGPAPTLNGTLTGSGAGSVLLASGMIHAGTPCTFNFPSNLFQWTGGIIDITSTIATNLGFVTVNTVSNNLVDGTFGLGVGGTLVNQGTFLQVNTGSLGLDRGIVFTNSPSGIYNLQSDGGISDSSGGWGGNEVDNVGLFVKSGGTNTSWVGVPLINYSGTIEIDSGTLALTAGNYDQNDGKLVIRLGGRNGGEFGALSVAGTARLSGTLQATLENGFTPSRGDKFQILSCSSLTGQFTTLNLPAGVSVNYSNNAVTLVVTSTGSGQPVNPRLAGGNFAFSVPSIMGQSYTVQTNADLSTANWGLYTNFVGNGSSIPVVASVNGRQLFFRIRQP